MSVLKTGEPPLLGTPAPLGGSGLNLLDFMRILRRNWVIVAAVTAVGVICGGASVLLIRPTYTAETQLFVAIQSSGSVQELQQGNTFSQARVQSYVKTVTAPVVLQPVIDSLGLSTSASELARNVKATTDINTVLINISVSDTSPVRAAATAEAVAHSLINAVDKLERPTTGGSSPVNLSIIAPAEAPQQPSAPNTKMNLGLGALLGLLAGIGTALIRSVLDTRIRGEADVQRVVQTPVLGGIAYDNDASKKPLLTQSAHQSPRAESFRQLRTNMQFANVAGKAKSLLITSSVPGEGKSTTATNLAIALAQGGQSVCLVDADLRRPMIHEYLRLERMAGLTTALVGGADINDLLQPWGEDKLYVLTSGQIPPNPSELLGSEAMRNLLQSLEDAFDTVIIDAPPLLPVTDAVVLSQHVGGVAVIVGVQRTRTQELAKSIAALKLVKANILGVVLNRIPVKGPDAYTRGYYGYYSDRGVSEEIVPTAISSDYANGPRPAKSYPRDLLEQENSSWEKSRTTPRSDDLVS